MIGTTEFSRQSNHIIVCLLLFGLFVLSAYSLQKVNEPYVNTSQALINLRDLNMMHALNGKDVNDDKNVDRFKSIYDTTKHESKEEKDSRLVQFMDDYYGNIDKILQDKLEEWNNMMKNIQSILQKNTDELQNVSLK